jgi:hypothetical protein
MVETDRFTLAYGLEDHKRLVGPAFEQDLLRWHAGMTVVHAGAHREYLARDLLLAIKAGERPVRGLPRWFAVGLVQPEDPWLAVASKKYPSLVYATGKLAQPGLLLEQKVGLGGAQRVLEHDGPSRYEFPNRVVESYGWLLARHGLLHFTVDAQTTHFEDRSGRPVDPVEYYQQVVGFRVRSVHHYAQLTQLEMQRTHHLVPSAPELWLDPSRYRAGLPPEAHYVVGDDSQTARVPASASEDRGAPEWASGLIGSPPLWPDRDDGRNHVIGYRRRFGGRPLRRQWRLVVPGRVVGPPPP